MERSTIRNLLAVCCLALSLPATVEAQVPGGGAVPAALLGEFVDDYGIHYAVSKEQWSQGEYARYEIAEWNVEDRFLIVRNGTKNRTEAGLWTRIDWILLPGGADFQWAFCYAVYDAESAQAARLSPSSDRDTPRTGCNGFPFSRMQRTSAPQR